MTNLLQVLAAVMKEVSEKKSERKCHNSTRMIIKLFSIFFFFRGLSDAS